MPIGYDINNFIEKENKYKRPQIVAEDNSSLRILSQQQSSESLVHHRLNCGDSTDCAHGNEAEIKRGYLHRVGHDVGVRPPITFTLAAYILTRCNNLIAK